MKPAFKVTLLVIVALVATITACKSSGGGDVDFSEFPRSITLKGKPVDVHDDELRTIGMVDEVDDGYVYYQYNSPYALCFSDKLFSKFTDFAVKGQAPGEVSGVSAMFAMNPGSHNFTVYDPYLMKLYETSFDSGLKLKELIFFPEKYSQYSPTQVLKLKDGRYVAARGDFKYGLVAYNPSTDEVNKWPLGGDFDVENPVPDEVSMRVVAYNQRRGIVGEIYGTIPEVYLHNENGDIIGRYNYTGYSKHIAPDNSTADCFMDLELSDNYIWLLYGDTDESDVSQVFVLDYDGNPIMQLFIPSSYAIAVDEANHRLLSVNPNNEDDNVIVYDLPDFHVK